MSALLLEIGMEEIPASMIATAQAELAQRVAKLLVRERIAADDSQVTGYSTPRRLAVLAEGIVDKQADMEEEVVGPSLKVAYKDNAPTPAAVAFAKKSGVEVSALKPIQNAKGEYVSATVRHAGRSAAEVLTGLLAAEIGGLSWPKSMYWRAGKPERFVRPVRWLLALLDEEVLPVEFAGVRADGKSYGHRVLHGGQPVVIRTPHEYVEKLEAAFVQVDAAARKQRIRKALDAVTRTIPSARWREDEELVDIVTNLTEWPTVILGSFEKSYLDLPEEVLVTVMRDHQKYFALEGPDGKLLPNFLTVLNLEVDEAGADVIRHGNGRVLRARFNDARFFWDMDQKIPLVDRVEMLKNVTFQKDLGSYWEKTERNVELSGIVLQLIGSDLEVMHHYGIGSSVSRAAKLAKADLTTEMVKEFPELQGIIGGLYADFQKQEKDVADAISDHYKPTSADDDIPRTRTGCIIALADKSSTVVDMFEIGLQPTGSKDPFALRRAGNGIIRILAENDEIGRRLHLFRLCQATLGTERSETNASLAEAIFKFLLDRFEFYLQEHLDINPQVSRAVRNSGVAGRFTLGADKPVGYGYVAGFAKALNKQVGSPSVLAVAESLKRTANILRQAGERKIAVSKNESDALLRETAEVELSRRVTEVNEKIQQNYREGKYSEVIAAIAGLQQPLNHFFDSVMVMVEDAKLRENRLALLSRTDSVVRWAADFSELASI